MKHLAPLSLKNLRTGSPQSLGAIRLVPLCRDVVPGDLRIRARGCGNDLGVVALEGPLDDPDLAYLSFIPQGLILSHTHDGSEATFGTSFRAPREVRRGGVRLFHRMVKREDDGGTERLRLLPMHLAMEGFLALHFNGPDILWKDYSKHAMRHGLDPRFERSTRGTWIRGLEAALRVFEMHPLQVGMMIFVADALASVFVVSHPDDYRRLHRSLIEDFFGDLLFEYAMLYPDVPRAETQLDPARVTSLVDLRAQVDRARQEWDAYARMLADGLFKRPVHIESVREMGPFRLQRFLPELDPSEECHIGERIVRDDGSVEYMKTFRLSAAQVRRAYLLEQLSRAQWNLDQAATHLKCTRDDLIARIHKAGFHALLESGSRRI